MNESERSTTMQRGLSALRAGDARGARDMFEMIVAAGQADASTFLAIGFACVQLEDNEGLLSAVDRALDLEPRNLRALLFKADHLVRVDRPREALTFYQAAIAIAQGMTEVPNDVLQGLQRAQQHSDQATREYEDYLRGALREKGYDERSVSRFAESLDIAVGRKPVHYQQPTRYYFPGLPQQAFYSREQFDWVPAMEAATVAIREELLAVTQEEGLFSPYLEHDPTLPRFNENSNVDSMDWSAFYLWRDGALVADNAARCPSTVEALAQVDAPAVPGQTPTALFSRLAPGATIAPHHGMLNTRLICHLPLVVPEDCGALRVGNEEHPWREGECLIFDDSMQHEAWNPSQQARVVLLFDVWRPELSTEEREWVTAMLMAVEAFGSA